MIPFFAKGYVAGETLDDAIIRVKQLNALSIQGIIDRLGESTGSVEAVSSAVQEYVGICKRIKKEKVHACISLKLSSIGLDVDKKTCLENLKTIAKQADKHGVFVWIDMENSAYVTDTLDVFEKVRYSNKNLGICLQADLKRTKKDLEHLLRKKVVIRLVKGVYKEQASVAYQSRDEVEENFVELMKSLFKSKNYFALGTHDVHLIHHARDLFNDTGKAFEFQMLMGAKPKLEQELVKDGFTVFEYVPFGENWWPYYSRRVMEKLGL